jgi:uncharacterized protein with von Willebrand factor type A (vWA) domain
MDTTDLIDKQEIIEELCKNKSIKDFINYCNFLKGQSSRKDYCYYILEYLFCESDLRSNLLTLTDQNNIRDYLFIKGISNILKIHRSNLLSFTYGNKKNSLEKSKYIIEKTHLIIDKCEQSFLKAKENINNTLDLNVEEFLQLLNQLKKFFPKYSDIINTYEKALDDIVNNNFKEILISNYEDFIQFTYSPNQRYINKIRKHRKIETKKDIQFRALKHFFKTNFYSIVYNKFIKEYWKNKLYPYLIHFFEEDNYKSKLQNPFLPLQQNSNKNNQAQKMNISSIINNILSLFFPIIKQLISIILNNLKHLLQKKLYNKDSSCNGNNFDFTNSPGSKKNLSQENLDSTGGSCKGKNQNQMNSLFDLENSSDNNNDLLDDIFQENSDNNNNDRCNGKNQNQINSISGLANSSGSKNNLLDDLLKDNFDSIDKQINHKVNPFTELKNQSLLESDLKSDKEDVLEKTNKQNPNKEQKQEIDNLQEITQSNDTDTFVPNPFEEIKKTTSKQSKFYTSSNGIGLGSGSIHNRTNKDDILKLHQHLLRSKTMKNFTDYLGKKEPIKKIEKIKKSQKTEVEGNNQETKPPITSVKMGNNINLTVSSDFLYSMDQELEDIFNLKYMESQLNVYKLKSIDIRTNDQNSYKTSNSSGKGPVFIIYDTSGSMSSFDLISKAMIYTIVKYVKYTNRSCFLINFSDNHIYLDLNSLLDKNQLLSFLEKSYGDGTDINSSIKEVYNNIQRKEYLNSDLVIISDFFIGDLSDENITYLNELKNDYNMRFYGIIMTDNYDDTDNELLDEQNDPLTTKKDNLQKNVINSPDITSYLDESWIAIDAEQKINLHKNKKYNIEEIPYEINQHSRYLYFGKN